MSSRRDISIGPALLRGVLALNLAACGAPPRAEQPWAEPPAASTATPIATVTSTSPVPPMPTSPPADAGTPQIGGLSITPAQPIDPANPRTLLVYSGAALTLRAEGLAHIARVIFFADPEGQLGREIGAVTELANGQAVLSWSPPFAGRYTMYAQASNERGEFVTSEAIELLVAPTGQEPPSP